MMAKTEYDAGWGKRIAVAREAAHEAYKAYLKAHNNSAKSDSEVEGARRVAFEAQGVYKDTLHNA